MKELKFVCVQPDDDYYIWQVHLWLENLREHDYSNKAIVLIFIPSFRDYNKKWDKLMSLYPEATFSVYKDEHSASKMLGVYIPILRPYTLWRWWTDHPEMKDKTVFYYDNDVLLTKNFNLDKFIDDDVCYVSDTNSYINASYFDSKIKDVKPDKLEDYKKIDVLAHATKLVGTTREVAEKNNLHSGGAQYLLKGIDAEFWNKMITDTLNIRLYLMNVVNKTYFENENKGFQSWCADMWALLWGLWAKGQEVRVIKELDFAWAPDPIEKLNTYPLYHNAGITGESMDGTPYFYKGKYHMGTNPFSDGQIDLVLNNELSKKKCNWFYVNELHKLNKKYNTPIL